MYSMVLMERNQLTEAEDLLVRSLEIVGWSSWIELHGFMMLARLRHLRGDDFGAQDTLQRMTRMGPQYAACAEAYQVWYAVERSPDDPEVRARANRWAHQNHPQTGVRFALGIGPYHCDTEYYCNLAWARVQIDLGYPQEAMVFIEPALKSAKEHGLVFRVVELSIAQALVYEGLGNSQGAMDEIGIALDIAERYGYSRVLDDSPHLDLVLQQAVAKNIHARFVKQLLVTFNRLSTGEIPVAKTYPRIKDPQTLVDPLSEREVEVLRYLANGLTPAEIAKRLFLSPHTLKAHNQNIYSKLDVHSRVEAINKARELGLL